MPEAKSASGKKRILIVEDEHPLAHALELKLGHEGFETTVCPTGKAGLEEGLKGGHDLILLDLILPEMDGFSVIAGLQEQHIKTPIIILSNLGQDEDRKKAQDMGVVAYLIKSNAPLAEILE